MIREAILSYLPHLNTFPSYSASRPLPHLSHPKVVGYIDVLKGKVTPGEDCQISFEISNSPNNTIFNLMISNIMKFVLL